MDAVALPAPFLAVLQTPTATPGVGPEELTVYGPVLVRAGWFLAGFLAVTVVGWFLVEPLVSRVVRRRNRRNPTIQEALSRYVRVLVLVVATFVGAASAGYGRLLANPALVIAAGTLAVGVAAQTVIGSLVSGLVLVMDPEFNVGDYIEWTDGAGTIQTITLRVTRLLTEDGELVTVPNTTLTGEAITRPYGRGRYRVVEHIGLDYDDDVSAALDQLAAAATGLDRVLDDPAPSAYVDEFGDEVIVARVHYWVDDPRGRDLFAIRSAYARAVKRRFADAGLTISPASEQELRVRLTLDESA